MDPTLYVDLRCLQDYGYRVRGIGHHITALLRSRSKNNTFARWRTVGLIDPKCPTLPHGCASLVDELSASLNPYLNSVPAVFVDGTPMTHDTRFSLRFVGNPAILSAAAVHDFIPLDWPGYLPEVDHRIDYLAKLARLRQFDYFLPVSDYAGWRLSEVLGISQKRMSVTGSSVRDSLYKLRLRSKVPAATYRPKRPYFLMVVGPDKRKNPEVVVKALRHLNLRHSARISLKVAGHFEQPFKDSLLQLAGHRENAGFLEFCFNVPDEELMNLFAGAVATIVPSHIEGFSLPVVEAAVCGCPVIASTCAAHLELVEHSEALFPSHDAVVLAKKLEVVLNDPSLRASILASQSHLGAKFHEDAVGHRFWSAIEGAVQNRPEFTSTSIATKKKPTLAFLSPYLPEQSEASFYTAMTMEAGVPVFHSDLYTDVQRPLDLNGRMRSAGPISVAPILGGHYDGVISVLGNSVSHMRSFDFFERYGGPCLLHDARLTQIYFQRLGQDKFLQFASDLLYRPVLAEELSSWLKDNQPSSLFLERVLERASPLIVQTQAQQALIRQHYGSHAEVVTSCPATLFDRNELTSISQQNKREHLGIAPKSFVVSSFGCNTRSKSIDTYIVATELLRSWRIPVELYLVGITGAAATEIDLIAMRYGIDQHVHCVDTNNKGVYRDFLLASDAGVQLRSYNFGAVSTVLSDCISAGLPAVATTDMAHATDAPTYTSTVPDHFSPLHVAEQIAAIWDSRRERVAYDEERSTYLTTHNFEYYARRLVEILEMA